ncbi:MAG: LacI family DNA-binding transcriptional regulator [Propionibacteriaceae bacterium]|nr:LacI family DNA-binding transcriptional regulator [Propionibacteriaceae bacterium]
MEIGREPRLGDVAERAGVSVATVSRVLNNRGYLSQTTRDRVSKAIEELDYRPNQVARSLLSQRTGTIGLIVPTVALPFYGEIAVGIENELAERGLRLLLCNSFGRADREREHLDLLVRNRVDGIISGAHNDPLPEYRTIRQPAVTIDRELAPHIPNVRAENERGGRLATEHLLSRGARRPAFLTSRSHERNLRERGYRAVLAEASIEPIILTADFHLPEPQRTQRVRDALDGHPDLDSVFATDDLLAASALEWAHDIGRRVPDDLRVVGFDGTLAMRRALPGLTTVQQPIAALCATAVDLLARRIDSSQRSGNESDEVPPVELPVTLIVGRTS